MAITLEQLLENDFSDLKGSYPWPDQFWIRANFVQSLNGRVTDKSKQLYLSSYKDKSLFRYLRATSDCLLVGRTTATIDHYQNVSVSKKYLPIRHTNNLIKVAIVSNSLEFEDGFFKEFNQKPLLITNEVAASKNSHLSADVDFVPLGKNSVDLALLTRTLKALGMKRVLCEGGTRLITELANANLLDEIDLTVASRLLATDEAGLFTKEFNPFNESNFEFKQVLFEADNLFMRILKK
ncbi:MAG: dihydrofolate reductase family protein [Candidatus Nanopelagicales bacterium]